MNVFVYIYIYMYYICIAYIYIYIYTCLETTFCVYIYIYIYYINTHFTSFHFVSTDRNLILSETRIFLGHMPRCQAVSCKLKKRCVKKNWRDFSVVLVNSGVIGCYRIHIKLYAKLYQVTSQVIGLLYPKKTTYEV